MQAASSPSQELTSGLSAALGQLHTTLRSLPAGPERQALLLLEGDAQRALSAASAGDSAAQRRSAALACYMDAAGGDGVGRGPDVAAEQAAASVKLALLCNALLRVRPTGSRRGLMAPLSLTALCSVRGTCRFECHRLSL